MPTITERNERMRRILDELKAEVMWVHGSCNEAPSLHSHDGNCVAVLPLIMLPVLDGLNDHDAGVVLESIADIASAESQRSFAGGKVVGRQKAIHDFHEFIGVTEICRAISGLFEDGD